MIDSADCADIHINDARNFRRRTEFPSYLKKGLSEVYGSPIHFPEKWKDELQREVKEVDIDETE